MKLQDVMSPVRHRLRLRDELRTAVQYLNESRFNLIPVTDEAERLIGVFTRTALYRMLLDGHGLNAPIEPYVKRDPVAYPADTPYEKIVEVVRRSRVGTGVVIDGDRRVLGLYTKVDMIASLFLTSRLLQEQLEAVLRSAHLGAFVVDRAETVLFVNGTLCRMLGRPEEEIVGRPLCDVLPGIVLPPDEAGRSVPYQIGPVRTLMRLSPYTSASGRVGWIGLFQELSDLEEMAQELESVRKWKTLLETTIEHAYDGLVMVNEAGGITFLNAQLAELFGLNKEACIGKPVAQALPQLGLTRVLMSGEAELSDVREYNGIRYLVQAIPVRQDGRMIGVIGKVLFRKLHEVRDVLRRLDVPESARCQEPIMKVHASRYTFDQIVTADPVMEKLKRTAAKAAKGLSTILLEGASGTGKEMFAHAIHQASGRRDGPFVTVNCAAIPEPLLEAEFFGYEPGAFTGAQKGGKIGKFDLAHGGTLFLDEIGDMPPRLQAKLLRVLQEKEFYRVGGTERVRVDVRIIAATNRRLEQMVERGEFREDLYYRLNVISLEIPPLKERRGDILLLARQFIQELNRQIGTAITGIEAEAEHALAAYDWPGNVRELRNVMERAMTLAEHGKIRLADLPDPLRRVVSPKAQEHRQTGNRAENVPALPLGDALEAAERQMIHRALELAGGNKSRAARLLGVSRSVLYEKLARHHLLP